MMPQITQNTSKEAAREIQILSGLEGLVIHQIDSFTRHRFTGNPAGVVPNADRLTDQQMQSIARELNNSETVFILKPDDDNHDLRLRFFTPTTEVPSCGHATIAAHFVRATELGITSGRVMQKTGIGILPVDIESNNGEIIITMTQGKPKVSSVMTEKNTVRLEQALGIQRSERNERFPVRIATTGHSKVMVALESTTCLNRLQPDLAALTELSKIIDCKGYFVFTVSDPKDDILVHGRMFAPAIGIAEDPVTGNANGPVGAYLAAERFTGIENGTFNFRARQGEAIGHPGEVDVSVDIKDAQPHCVRISGNAVNVFKARL